MSDDVISVDEFAAGARSWLADEHAARRSRRRALLLQRTSRRAPTPTTSPGSSGAASCSAAVRRRLRRDLRPDRVRRAGAHARAPVRVQPRAAGYDFPLEIQVSTFIPCMAVLLEFGTEEQKLRHVPRMLRGEEVWAQFLSEPSGGSDAAGAVTTAVRDGDQWVLNGSKIWTTGAWYSDWAMCLARTNWDVEKHRGPDRLQLPGPQPGRRDPSDRARQRLEGVLPGVPHRRGRPRPRPRRRRRRRLDRDDAVAPPRADRSRAGPRTSPARGAGATSRRTTGATLAHARRGRSARRRPAHARAHRRGAGADDGRRRARALGDAEDARGHAARTTAPP